MKRILTCVIMLAVFFSVSMSAFADSGNVTYLGSAKEFIFEPGSVYSPTDLFPEFKEVMPGDRISQVITLKNDPSNKVKVKLYMRSLGARSDSKDFLSKLDLEVIQLEETELFDAKADKAAQLEDWTYLGTLYSGGEIDLELTLEVPKSLGNEYSNRRGYLEWEFHAIVCEPEPTDPKPAKTGDDANILLWGGCLAVAGAAMIVVKRRKEK